MPPHERKLNSPAASRQPGGNGRCAGDVSLPVVNDGRDGTRGGSAIRASKNWPKRVIVLTVVHVFIIAHIIHWLVSGRTTTPIEPSEAMEFTRQGVVNMGLIFFALALLSTLILGRWFCGWGCHVVFLQDGCSWIMRKLGVRPKPFRSRLLIYVPLILAFYMFLWPAVYRLGVAPLMDTADQLPAWSVQAHLTTDEFWRTFPGVIVAIPFLLICGFACVYFLGSKGFCTYGCPYGGFFTPVDEFAPGRIRVTDDCEGCGHCTAVCTSNVRVHEEVREYGMVVDPGCMKCLDCVSVCPKNALYFGFGKPALKKGPPKRAMPKKRYDLTWPEEITFALVFLGSFFAYRGLYAVIPMLMAVGMAGVTTFVLWKLWRMIRDANVPFLRHRLVMHGRVTKAGWAFGSLAVFALAFTLLAGAARGSYAMADYYDRQITISMDDAFFSDDETIRAEFAAAASRGLLWYDLAAALTPRHVGLRSKWDIEFDVRRAWLHVVQENLNEAERLLTDAVERDGMREDYAEGILMIHLSFGRGDAAFALAEDVLLNHQSMYRVLEHVVRLMNDFGWHDQAVALCEARLERFPEDVPTIRWLAMLNLDLGQMNDGITLLKRAMQLAPNDQSLPMTLAMVMDSAGRRDEAIDVLTAALNRMPESRVLHQQMAQQLQRMGRLEEADRYRQRAEDLDQTLDPRRGYESPIAE